MIVESDPTHESGLKAHAISKEEFDKKYSKISAAKDKECPTFPVLPGAPGGPAFPQEEKKKAALNPDELAG